MKRINVLIIFLMVYFFPHLIFAHIVQLSDSELQWNPPQVEWNLRVHLTDFNQKFLNIEDSVVKDYISKQISITQDQAACKLIRIDLNKDIPQEVVSIHLCYECPSKTSDLNVSYELFYGDLNHKHLLKMIRDGNVSSYTFSPQNTEKVFSVRPNVWDEIKNFIKLGLEHILTGYDHILFVLSLILGARRFKTLFWLATAFTLAHSISLSLAAFDILTLSPRIVEPLIAASIIFVALSNCFKAEESNLKSHIPIVFGFGLIHGLGFSSALKEANLDRGNLAIPLFCFNLGVELGQILIIGVVYPLLILLRKKLISTYPIIKRILLVTIAIAGAYWMIQRIFFNV